jgi:hypothetical protein
VTISDASIDFVDAVDSLGKDTPPCPPVNGGEKKKSVASNALRVFEFFVNIVLP